MLESLKRTWIKIVSAIYLKHVFCVSGIVELRIELSVYQHVTP
jgi:hypothetical protein